MGFISLKVEVFLYSLLVSKLRNFSKKKTVSFLKLCFVDPNLLSLEGPNYEKMCYFKVVFQSVNK